MLALGLFCCGTVRFSGNFFYIGRLNFFRILPKIMVQRVAINCVNPVVSMRCLFYEQEKKT